MQNWNVPDLDIQDEKKKSILDADPEVQAMMEMTGKTLHSQGLREPEEDEGQWWWKKDEDSMEIKLAVFLLSVWFGLRFYTNMNDEETTLLRTTY